MTEKQTSFSKQARKAYKQGKVDAHGNHTIRFSDGTYATFVSGKTWAHWPKS